MAVKPVVYYTVECDESDCTTDLADLGGDYSAWADAASAKEAWESGDGLVADDGGTYCPKHGAQRVCVDCERTVPTVRVVEDRDGERRCEGCFDKMRLPCEISSNVRLSNYCTTHGDRMAQGDSTCASAATFSA